MKGILLVLVMAFTGSFHHQSVSTDESSTLFLVRHAEKADDGTRDPDLTKIGKKRAVKLASILEDENISYVFSSDYKRTRQTAQPLAEKLGIEVKIYNPGDFSEIIKFIDEHPGSNMLIVGHSNSTPSLANAILEEEKYEQYSEKTYSNLLKIVISKDDKSSEMLSF